MATPTAAAAVTPQVTSTHQTITPAFLEAAIANLFRCTVRVPTMDGTSVEVKPFGGGATVVILTRSEDDPPVATFVSPIGHVYHVNTAPGKVVDLSSYALQKADNLRKLVLSGKTPDLADPDSRDFLLEDVAHPKPIYLGAGVTRDRTLYIGVSGAEASADFMKAIFPMITIINDEASTVAMHDGMGHHGTNILNQMVNVCAGRIDQWFAELLTQAINRKLSGEETAVSLAVEDLVPNYQIALPRIFVELATSH